MKIEQNALGKKIQKIEGSETNRKATETREDRLNKGNGNLLLGK